jgi:hypothetical protein
LYIGATGRSADQAGAIDNTTTAVASVINFIPMAIL